jgi:hypothetical protein
MSVDLTPAPDLPSLSDPATFNSRAIALLNWIANTLVSEIEGIEASDYFSVQSSLTDTTAGALMKVGAFGWGHANSSLDTPPSNDLDALAVVGFWRYNSTTVGAPSGSGVVMHINRIPSSDVGGMMQMAITHDGRIHTRRTSSATGPVWQPWQEFHKQNTMVGTVSEDSGTPTGAIIEQGSNANGEYTRWADGTQICTNGNAAITTAPAAFTGTITKVDGDKLWVGRWF